MPDLIDLAQRAIEHPAAALLHEERCLAQRGLPELCTACLLYTSTPATFSVQAHSQRGEALSYQWFYLDTSNNAYAEWKPIVGETGPDYVIDAAKTQWTGTLF